MLPIATEKFPTKPLLFRLRISSLLAAVVLLLTFPAKQDTVHAQAVQTPDTSAVLHHLNAAIDWYRNVMRMRVVGQPSDEIYQSNAQSLAAQAVQFAFQSAKAEAALLPSSPQQANTAPGDNAAAARIDTLRNDVNARISQLNLQITSLNQQIAKASRNKLNDLKSQRASLDGELDLDKAVLNAIEQFAQSNDAALEDGKTGLVGRIDQLEQSVPELSAGKKAPAPANPRSTLSNPQGLVGGVATLYEQLQSTHEINQLNAQTNQLRSVALSLRGPLQTMMRAAIQQGQTLANQLTQGQQANAAPAQAGTASAQAGVTPATGSREQFDALAAKFKQLAAANLPLRQELTALDQSNANLKEWHDSLIEQSGTLLRSVLLRVASIAIAICFVLFLSEMWKRVTFRYIHDIRRRRQFLVLRRVVVGFCMAIVLILGFVSEFSSLATFAGFITAGIAVGLQTILLSVAAYFFLVGRWGIRVGDRISVAGVTGDVVDVGLVRMYLLELAGTGVDLHPTGRVVVFANSVLFQATTPLFKQLPGTEYTWHEVAVSLQPGQDYKLVEDKVLEAVNSVYLTYRDVLAQQHGDAERKIEFQVKVPEPHAQLQYTETGLEYVVRYPVGLDRVDVVDNEVTRKLLEVTKQPDLQSAFSGLPKIRAAIKG